jgi:hypothetical protein
MQKWVLGSLIILIVLLAVPVFAADTVVVNGKTLQGPELASLTCNQQNKVDDRIVCRLKVEPSDKLMYWPEDCMLMSGDAEKECLAITNAEMPCRLKKTIAEREACFQDLLGIENAEVAYNKCLKLDGSYRRMCYQDLSNNIMKMANFRLNELMDRIVEAYTRGVSEYRCVGMMKRIGIAKQDLANAQTQDDKIAALTGMRHDWSLFAQQAQGELNATK